MNRARPADMFSEWARRGVIADAWTNISSAIQSALQLQDVGQLKRVVVDMVLDAELMSAQHAETWELVSGRYRGPRFILLCAQDGQADWGRLIGENDQMEKSKKSGPAGFILPPVRIVWTRSSYSHGSSFIDKKERDILHQRESLLFCDTQHHFLYSDCWISEPLLLPISWCWNFIISFSLLLQTGRTIRPCFNIRARLIRASSRPGDIQHLMIEVRLKLATHFPPC